MQSHVDTDALLRDISARLDPNRILVDDRSLRDRLAFIASLAELIVFYDEHNQPTGNWRALVIKDPVILLAVISKTSYQQLDARFSRIQPSFRLIRQQMSQPEGAGESASPDWPERVRNTVSQLLSVLDKMFQSLEGWMTVMTAGKKDYHLRQFLEQKIRHSLAPALSQRIAVQNYLATMMKSCVAPVAAQAFRHWLPLWKSSAGVNTRFDSVPEAMDLLEQLYQQVFSCYVQVITSARQAFEQLCEQPCDFPDTALLMTFHRLLMYSQQGLNQYSQQHLQFYYQDILHQQVRGALPDRAYLCLTPAPGHTSLTLPAGTQFVGGRYADSTPILFASIRSCEVNTAQLGRLFSSSYRLTGDVSSLNEMQQHDSAGQQQSVSRQQYLEQLPDTRKIRRDSTTQQVLACDWFGGEQTQTVQQGFVLSSPMLALRSGIRVLTMTFSLDQPVQAELWQGATSWFSGKKGWFQASDVQWAQGETSRQLRLTMTLQSQEPAVEAFSQPPGGYESVLPYCRIMLPASLDLRTVPRLLTLDFQVSVTQSDSFSLLSDNGPLVPGKPMPILGAIPEAGSHCYIRDAEIVDKPLTQLDLTLSWENIPADFSVYFSAYNTFLYHQGGEKQTWHNTAFRIAWQTYTADGWQPTAAQISAVPNDEAPDAQPTHKRHWWQRLWHRHPPSPQPIVQQSDGLFAQQWGMHKHKMVAENASGTHYQFSFPEPQRCLEASLTGHPQLRMTLIAPADGFGHGIYAQLVAAISLENAKILMNGAGLLGPVVKVLRGLGHLVGMKSLGRVQPLPPLPWVVKAQQATLSYQAAQSFDFTDPTLSADKEQGHGTLTLLHIGALATYPYFSCQSEQTHPSVDLRHMKLQPVPDAEKTPQGLALYNGVSRPANSLYIQLTEVIRPCRVNLLIELAQDLSREPQSGEPSRSEVSLYYWSDNGWEALSVLLDQTSGLTRSGLVQIDLPQNVVLNPPQFPQAESKTASDTQGKAGPITQGCAWLLMTQASARRVACVYCNTQGIEVIRQAPISLPVGETPVLAAGKINAPAVKNPALAGVVQPFASVGGRAQESEPVFRERVSQRLKTKDRAVADWDYILLTKQACPSLFHVRHLPEKASGCVHLGVVQSYPSAQIAHAFRPVVPRDQIQQIIARLMQSTSAMTQVRVTNLLYEPVSVVATVVIRETTNASDLLNALHQGVNLYLSPWIAAEQQQYRLGDGLSRTAVTRFLATFDGIVAVPALQLMLSETAENPHTENTEATTTTDNTGPERLMPATANRIFVSSFKHTFRLTRAGSPEQQSSGVAQNRLTEAY
ncbi:baseplate J/gp47 family protein [Vibrio sp. MEBiC08052]|uniref:baseplate J/gp47 family protein n=1 Tax=Vibrio sp. MEBiC08052 TaxID=1761910 RepID=UPI0007407996|nr:baseplate J/gp47 family protein [Vibrio sp. MEBiC08052]KUI96886.1 hypothetical protein VRK_40670 [Vibrio sp. MEBiC08052]